MSTWTLGDDHECPLSSRVHRADDVCVTYARHYGDRMFREICECCLGDPDLVCAECGDHACWAGYFFCQAYLTADVITKAEFESRLRDPARAS